VAGRIRSIEKIHLIETQSLDLPACSTVPLPTMLLRGLINTLSRYLTERTEEGHEESVRLAGVPAEIRPRRLPNTSQASLLCFLGVKKASNCFGYQQPSLHGSHISIDVGVDMLNLCFPFLYGHIITMSSKVQIQQHKIESKTVRSLNNILTLLYCISSVRPHTKRQFLRGLWQYPYVAAGHLLDTPGRILD
jgi:hypothetical protein